MFFCLPDDAQQEVAATEALLHEHNPWPAQAMGRLSKLAANTPEGEKRFADFRLLVLDVDSLLQETRWAIGNALLILRAFPEVTKPFSDVEETFDRIGVPSRVHLLISELVVGRDRVIYQDLLERRPGEKRVGAWMIQILADHAVTSSIGVLDRLAHLLMLAGDANPPRGRMYFRSGKLGKLNEQRAKLVDEAVIDLSLGEDLDFLLSYRDGLAHTMRLNVTSLNSAAVDRYLDEEGEVQTFRSAAWSAAELTGIGLMGFELSKAALLAVEANCERLLATAGPAESRDVEH